MPCLALDARDDLAIPMRLARGDDVVAVRVSLRLRTYLGEWITDTAMGLPWRTWITDGGPSPLEASALVRGQLEVTPGVVEVVSCTARKVTATTVAVQAVCRVREEGEDGTLTVTSTFDPFATSGAPAWYITTGTPAGGRW